MSIVPLSDERGSELLAPMTADQRMASIHVRLPDRTIHSAGAAAVCLGRALPGLRHAAAIAQRSQTATRLVESAYAVVAKHRHRLARFVPDREAVTRWRD